MAREPVFYSFHYDHDVMRVQQVRNMGVLDGDEPVSPNDWERVWRRGDAAIQSWIDSNMKYKKCVVVLIGAETATRPWVKYEIKKAWDERKGLVGIHIHNLECPRSGKSAMGANPFNSWLIGGQWMSSVIKTHNPSAWDAYNDIHRNLSTWVNTAIYEAQRR